MNQDATDLKLAMWAEQARKDSLTDLEALTEFVVKNAELEQLEEKLRQFNFFEAVGMQWQEIRHSAFLAFLLDPQQPHGLSDDFLKTVLQRALLRDSAATASSKAPVNAVELYLMALTQTGVERERNNIDILLLNEPNKIAVVIENKVGTGEHDNQLDRYYQTVQKQYPHWRILGLYLTRDGAAPSDRRYLPVSYGDIADLVESLAVSRESVIGPDVRTIMTHYVQMLRRNLVDDAELDALCRQIYQKHKRAIDRIIQHIPDRRQQIMDFCKSYLASSDDLRIQYSGPLEVDFIPKEWDVPALKYAPPIPDGIFQFYIRHFPVSGLMLYLTIRPGRQETRQKLYDMAKSAPELFAVGNRRLKPKYFSVFSRRLVSASDLLNVDVSMLQSAITGQIQQFINDDLPKFQAVMKELDWVWDENADYASDGEVVGGGNEDDETA